MYPRRRRRLLPRLLLLTSGVVLYFLIFGLPSPPPTKNNNRADKKAPDYDVESTPRYVYRSSFRSDPDLSFEKNVSDALVAIETAVRQARKGDGTAQRHIWQIHLGRDKSQRGQDSLLFQQVNRDQWDYSVGLHLIPLLPIPFKSSNPVSSPNTTDTLARNNPLRKNLHQRCLRIRPRAPNPLQVLPEPRSPRRPPPLPHPLVLRGFLRRHRRVSRAANRQLPSAAPVLRRERHPRTSLARARRRDRRAARVGTAQARLALEPQLRVRTVHDVRAAAVQPDLAGGDRAGAVTHATASTATWRVAGRGAVLRRGDDPGGYGAGGVHRCGDRCAVADAGADALACAAVCGC